MPKQCVSSLLPLFGKPVIRHSHGGAGVSFVSSLAANQARIDLLRSYMAEHVLGPCGFVCTSYQECYPSAVMTRDGRPRADRSFSEGQLSHVGAHYDLTEDGRPLRILVVAMETGRPDRGVSLEQRREQIMQSASLDYRSRNPHMRGTTQALRLAVGRAVGEDRSGEVLDLEGSADPVHLFDCYAMANIRLCSATVTGTSASTGTRTMSRNCLRHLAATVTILEPTLCIVQGVQVARDLEALITRRNSVNRHVALVRLAGVETVLATFTHPSAKSLHLHWGRIGNAPYLTEVVQPTIRRAREVLADRRYSAA